MTTLWPSIAPSAISSFLASIVEFVEALTIVLAVGVTRGWRSAFIGTATGVVTLAILVAIFGPALTLIPIVWFQLVIGILLLLFGIRWLRKAILRSAGVIALHDEEKIYGKQVAELSGAKSSGLDMIGFATAFKAVLLEGLEVVFIVIATGSASGTLVPSTIGALVAGVIVLAAGFIVHRPLSKVPENALKAVVGLLLTSFGIFWIGEGLGCPWPAEDFSLFGIFALLLLTYRAGVWLSKNVRPKMTKPKAPSAPKGVFRSALSEITGLLIEDASLAVASFLWVAACAFMFLDPIVELRAAYQPYVLTIGFVFILAENVRRNAGKIRGKP